MNALGRAFLDFFDPLPAYEGDVVWQWTVVRPFLERLAEGGGGWQSEDDVCDGNVGMSIIGARCFWAKQLGLIEYKMRAFRRGWWIRMTPKGWRWLRDMPK